MNTSNEKERPAPNAIGTSKGARLMMHVVMVMLAMLFGLGGAYRFVGNRASQNIDDVLGRFSRVFGAPRRAEAPLRQGSVPWMSDGPLRRNLQRSVKAIDGPAPSD